MGNRSRWNAPRLTRRGLLGCGLVGLAGCLSVDDRSSTSANPSDWPQFRGNPAGTGFNPESTGPRGDLRIRWQYSLGTHLTNPTEAIVVGKTAYHVVMDRLLAVDSTDGTIRHTTTLDGQYPTTPALGPTGPYRTPTLVVVGENTTRGIDASGGIEITGISAPQTRWETPSSGREPPVLLGDRSFGYGPDGTVRALDVTDGSTRWRAGDEPVRQRTSVNDEQIVYLEGDRRVISLDRSSGTTQWETPLGEDDIPHWEVPPIIADDRVVVHIRGTVLVLDGDSGDELHRISIESPANQGSPAIADDIAYVPIERERGDEDVIEHGLAAIDLETGESRFTVFEDVGSSQIRSVSADAEQVYCSVGRGIVALDRETGEHRWTYDDGQIYDPKITPAHDQLFVAGQERLFVLDEP